MSSTALSISLVALPIWPLPGLGRSQIGSLAFTSSANTWADAAMHLRRSPGVLIPPSPFV